MPSTAAAPVESPTEEPPNAARSRRGFLRLAGVGGASGAAALFLAACGGDDDKQASTAAATTAAATSGADGDVEILNYALTLEHLEADFYAKVIDSGLLKRSETDLAKRFGDTEQQHVQALTATIKQLGGTPVAAPQTKFPLKSRMAVLKLAATVENLGAAAYLGQAGLIKSSDVLAAALSIHSVEARHAAALNHLLGQSSTPDGAFAKPADKATVLAAVKPFIVA